MGEPRDTLLHEVLLANRQHLAGSPVPRPTSLGEKSLLVITCMDPRLTALLPAVMGVASDEMIQIRNAGNRALDPERDPVRSAVAAIVLGLADEVFVIGHTDCRMCGSTTVDVLDGMKARGLSREAFGSKDVRAWFGLIASERSNTMEAAKVMRESPLLPPGIPLHALLVDTATGRLDLLSEGYTRAAIAAPSTPVSTGPIEMFEPPESSFDPGMAAVFESIAPEKPPAPARPVPPPKLPPPPPEPAHPAPPPPPPPRARSAPAPKPRSEPASPFERAEDVLERLMKRRRR